MSRRKSILNALAEKFKDISTSTGYKTELGGCAYPKLMYWDEVHNFPSVYMLAGTESREYLPSNLTWGYLDVALKLYCKGELADQELEDLLEDVEDAVEKNRVLVYDQDKGFSTTEILITSITTDEGHLRPFAVGEINLQVRYIIM